MLRGPLGAVLSSDPTDLYFVGYKALYWAVSLYTLEIEAHNGDRNQTFITSHTTMVSPTGINEQEQLLRTEGSAFISLLI